MEEDTGRNNKKVKSVFRQIKSIFLGAIKYNGEGRIKVEWKKG